MVTILWRFYGYEVQFRSVWNLDEVAKRSRDTTSGNFRNNRKKIRIFFLLFRFCAIFCVLADFHTFSREVQTLLEARLICMVCLSQLKRWDDRRLTTERQNYKPLLVSRKRTRKRLTLDWGTPLSSSVVLDSALWSWLQRSKNYILHYSHIKNLQANACFV